MGINWYKVLEIEFFKWLRYCFKNLYILFVFFVIAWMNLPENWYLTIDILSMILWVSYHTITGSRRDSLLFIHMQFTVAAQKDFRVQTGLAHHVGIIAVFWGLFVPLWLFTPRGFSYCLLFYCVMFSQALQWIFMCYLKSRRAKWKPLNHLKLEPRTQSSNCHLLTCYQRKMNSINLLGSGTRWDGSIDLFCYTKIWLLWDWCTLRHMLFAVLHEIHSHFLGSQEHWCQYCC